MVSIVEKTNSTEEVVKFANKPDVKHVEKTSEKEPKKTKKKKKKKKKNSYKSMMAAIMKSSSSTEERKQQNKQHISNSLGGGQFEKFERI
mgnify:CR=1 FL=1